MTTQNQQTKSMVGEERKEVLQLKSFEKLIVLSFSPTLSRLGDGVKLSSPSSPELPSIMNSPSDL